MSKVIWFNHWFSSAYNIINLIHSGVDDVHIIGSNTSDSSVIKTVCDEWYKEPSDMHADAYVRFCLNFCIKHKVDIFVPRREAVAIGHAAKDFADIGVKLLLDSNATILFDDKLRTYRCLAEVIPGHIPEFFEVKSLDDFDSAYSAITHAGNRMIFKYSSDEGGTSFRVIDDSLVGSNALNINPGAKLPFSTARMLVQDQIGSHTFIAMPYLNGIEVSCDCLAVSDTDRIVLARYKLGGRVYAVRNDEKLTKICNEIIDYSKLNAPCNIQFRYHNDKLCLLEVNTRMSGGIQLSCAASGINIPALAVNKLLNRPLDYTKFNGSKTVSYAEVSVCLT